MDIFNRPEREHIKTLLSAADLPTDDLAALNLSDFLGSGDRNAPSGVIGLEAFGDNGLLRSLVVSPDTQSHGCGRALVAGIEHLARQRGIRSLYLLTTTAEHFFAKLGYATIDRDITPQAIRQTSEFSQLCPNNATVMLKTLESPPNDG